MRCEWVALISVDGRGEGGLLRGAFCECLQWMPNLREDGHGLGVRVVLEYGTLFTVGGRGGASRLGM
jgi:hypothetical protein